MQDSNSQINTPINTLHNDEYLLRSEFEREFELEKQKVKNEIEVLKSEIQLLQREKVDNEKLNKSIAELKQDIALLYQKLNDFAEDRKEDKREIVKLSDEVKRISDAISNTNLMSIEIKTNQSNTFDKIKDLKEDISNTRIELKTEMNDRISEVKVEVNSLKMDMTSLKNDMAMLKQSIENSPLNIVIRLVKNNKIFRTLFYIALSFCIFSLISAGAFYITNGIDWSKIKDIMNFIK